MASSPAPQTISQVKAHVSDHLRVRSSATGICLFLVSSAGYTASFAVTLAPVSPWIRLLASLANAVFIATLFIVGHDACHGALTPKVWLNKLLGRLSFLASWHPYVSWDLGHNKIHHSWTNLKGRDYVWTPLSQEEFRALPRRRQVLERFYRTLPGVGIYYLYEIWFKHMVFPTDADRKRMSPSLLNFDRMLVALFVAAQLGAAAYAATHFQTPLWMAVVLAVLLPQLLWNQLMGLVILLHHTHPKVQWFDDPDKWSFFNGQVRGTVHVKFPWPIGTLLHHIMDHTAHHVDTRIPLYHLPDAQIAMEKSFPDDVIISSFSWNNLNAVLRDCQLYDYERHQWLSFASADTVKSMPDRARHSATPALEPSFAYVTPSPLVLLIQGTTDSRIFFQHCLKTASVDYRAVESAAEAVRMAASQKFDLIVLDLGLFGGNGDGLFLQLKALNPRTPVAIIADDPDSVELNRVLEHGPTLVLSSPLDGDQVRLMVERLRSQLTEASV